MSAFGQFIRDRREGKRQEDRAYSVRQLAMAGKVSQDLQDVIRLRPQFCP